ncbi:spore coat U domain-containing protein [Variovorax paradoxus]|uniref:spore coat U domain-containing protein n=1 Tax=Variovorax paradoxus TaxID=34073 RepID=UPI00278120F0|nr:spore coat U domain-containing protein [Variovorax paradoxus]MDQ0586625.1 spore coat protein U-like protein [Variovorax paradoxus]
MNKKMIKVALAVGATVMAGASMAATEEANLTVGATVVNACAIGPGTLAFGGALSAAVASAGTAGTTADVDADSGTSISIICTNGASAAITGGGGANAVGSVRNMLSGADLLPYELYTSSGRATVFNATNSIAYTGTGAATTTTAIYGRILGADLAAAKKGTYADTVAMTITYTP